MSRVTPYQLKIPASNKTYNYGITKFNGLDMTESAVTNSYSNCADCLNVYADDNNLLATRPRLEKIDIKSVPWSGRVIYTKKLDADYYVVCWEKETTIKAALIKLDNTEFKELTLPVTLIEGDFDFFKNNQNVLFLITPGKGLFYYDEETYEFKELYDSNKAYVPNHIVVAEVDGVVTKTPSERLNTLSSTFKSIYTERFNLGAVIPEGYTVDVFGVEKTGDISGIASPTRIHSINILNAGTNSLIITEYTVSLEDGTETNYTWFQAINHKNVIVYSTFLYERCTDYDFSKDGNLVAYSSMDEDKNQTITVYDIEKQESYKKTTKSSDFFISAVRFDNQNALKVLRTDGVSTNLITYWKDGTFLQDPIIIRENVPAEKLIINKNNGDMIIAGINIAQWYNNTLQSWSTIITDNNLWAGKIWGLTNNYIIYQNQYVLKAISLSEPTKSIELSTWEKSGTNEPIASPYKIFIINDTDSIIEINKSGIFYIGDISKFSYKYKLSDDKYDYYYSSTESYIDDGGVLYLEGSKAIKLVYDEHKSLTEPIYKITSQTNIEREVLNINRACQFDNLWWFYSTKSNRLYYTGDSSAYYLPEKNYFEIGSPDPIKTILQVSNNYLAIFKENETYVLSASEDLNTYVWRVLKTKQGSMNEQGAIVSAYTNLPLVQNQFGISGLTQAENVFSIDNVFTPLATKIFKKYEALPNKDKAISHNHKYLTYIAYPANNGTKILVLDNRSLTFFYWELPIEVKGFIERIDFEGNSETMLVADDGRYVLTTSMFVKGADTSNDKADDYYAYQDYVGQSAIAPEFRRIKWFWKTAPLALNTLYYLKNIINIGLSFVDDDRKLQRYTENGYELPFYMTEPSYRPDNLQIKYNLKGYRKNTKFSESEYSGTLDYVRVLRIKPRLSKLDYVELTLSNYSTDGENTSLTYTNNGELINHNNFIIDKVNLIAITFASTYTTGR